MARPRVDKYVVFNFNPPLGEGSGLPCWRRGSVPAGAAIHVEHPKETRHRGQEGRGALGERRGPAQHGMGVGRQ